MKNLKIVTVLVIHLYGGNERDNILFKSKILINIHHRELDYFILEEIRITRCILNKIIVISEYSLEYTEYPLAKFMIFTEYDNLVNKTIDVLNNYDLYYKNLFEDFNIDDINNKLYSYLKSNLNL